MARVGEAQKMEIGEARGQKELGNLLAGCPGLELLDWFFSQFGVERTELEGQQVDEEEEVRDKDKDTLHLDWGGANFRANWAMRGWLPGDYEGQITRRMRIADICEIVYAK